MYCMCKDIMDNESIYIHKQPMLFWTSSTVSSIYYMKKKKTTVKFITEALNATYTTEYVSMTKRVRSEFPNRKLT